MADLSFPIIRPYGAVTVTLQVYRENDVLICGLRRITGHIDLPYRAKRKAIALELQTIEAVARAAGCTEIRHAGGDRGWMLPGYEPFAHPELKNARRKRL